MKLPIDVAPSPSTAHPPTALASQAVADEMEKDYLSPPYATKVCDWCPLLTDTFGHYSMCTWCAFRQKPPFPELERRTRASYVRPGTSACRRAGTRQ